MTRILILISIGILLFTGCKDKIAPKKQNTPNVILILTDDQGIGDMSCHGNPWIKTPNIDNFYNEGVRFTDFHVSPMCTPTRAALMTGQYPISNGAWATIKGRDALSENTQTIADIFRQNGYKTALFGKWHLGDNYPVRPTDCGFEVAIHHLAGGVGELSDYWGNSYFDDVYYVNNEPKQFEGYCTDVWFSETIKFIDENKDEPFFIYLPLNAPHDPLIVAEEYAEPYKHLEGDSIVSADLYGMIANIDENFGKFREYLQANNLEDNTILIFMTDNGTRFGMSYDGKVGYNKGYSGIKGSKFEGGHRVPFFIRWPKGNILGGKDINTLAAHVDILPTLASMCGITVPEHMHVDGIDISPLFTESGKEVENRNVYVHHRQDWRQPHDINETCIVSGKWRLVNGTQLYNIEKDPKQINDISHEYPKIVEKLLAENQEYLKQAKIKNAYNELPVHVVGNDAQKEIKLTIQHAIGEGYGIWKCEQVAEGIKNGNNTHAIRIDKAGKYEISCCRWPKECPGPIWGVPDSNPKNMFAYKAIKPEKVRISIANQIHEKEIIGNEYAVTFNVDLEEGKTLFVNDFIEKNEKYGVYYTYIRKVE